MLTASMDGPIKILGAHDSQLTVERWLGKREDSSTSFVLVVLLVRATDVEMFSSLSVVGYSVVQSCCTFIPTLSPYT